MAIKGPAYIRTTWSFEERPVASSKLNTWDDRIATALEFIFLLLNGAWGGGNGVLRGLTPNDLEVVATAVPGMSVEVRPGYAFINKFPFRLAASTATTDVAPPLTNPRIDLVQAALETGGIVIKQGTEAASPAAPAASADHLALAALYLRPGMTAIKNTDDAVNGYIVDARAFL